MCNDSKKMDLTVLVGLLKQSSKLDRFSSCVTIISLLLSVIVIFASTFSLTMISLSIIILILGFVEKYFAIRVDFDRSLFKCLQAYSDAELMSALTLMDQSLCRLGLIKKDYDPSRSLESRIIGTICLFKKQLVCCVVQGVLLICITTMALVC